jgi:hypothetical protein
MSKWTDLAHWVGPTDSRNAGGTVECRGIVVHIAEGFYLGTISYQRNPANEVSSHFIVDRDGTVGQMVDTADKAWTQKSGNGHWISVECAGFTVANPLHASHPGWEKLTDAQVAAVARIFARAHQVYGVPLHLATSPTGKGLGHHSMGSTAWGHLDCPGNPIIAQKPAILAAAINPASASTEDPLSQLNDTQLLHLIQAAERINDAFSALGSYQVPTNLAETTSVTEANPLLPLKSIPGLVTTLAASATREQATLTAIQALTAGGTSVDTAAVIAKIDAVAAAESATVAALQQQLAAAQASIASLTAKLASAGDALSG